MEVVLAVMVITVVVIGIGALIQQGSTAQLPAPSASDDVILGSTIPLDGSSRSQELRLSRREQGYHSLLTGKSGRAHIERSDVAILPRAAVVGEAMVALALADQLLHTFGGDTIGDLQAAVRRRRARSIWPRGGAARAQQGVSALPDNAAAEATPVVGTDA